MNNEPVAWMDEETGCFVYSQYDYEDLDEHGKDGLIPLYTHLVKEQEFTSGKVCPSCGCNSLLKTNRSEWCVTHKCLWQSDYGLELTDEEIIHIWNTCETDDEVEELVMKDFILFARAILRRANEK